MKKTSKFNKPQIKDINAALTKSNERPARIAVVGGERIIINI